MSTPLPMPPPPSMPPPLSMSAAPSLSGLLPMLALHLPNLGLVRTTISFNKLINTIFLYDHAVVPHEKPWKNKDMALFEMGHVSCGTAMAAYKLQPKHIKVEDVKLKMAREDLQNRHDILRRQSED
ncbi:hypothetical protein JHK85_025676 [Glycine max]|nr:hypothetical protein JHK85_025676 [Glycine max]